MAAVALDEGPATRTRLARGAPRALMASRLAIILIGLALAVALALPGASVVTKALEDLFVALDGAHHVLAGQVPNRDFHSALGPIPYLLPALGFSLSGNYGAALPLGLGLLLVLLTLIAAHVLASRLRPFLAIGFGAFVLLILAVPINLGEGINALSFAQYYNRMGWASLALLLVLYLPASVSAPRTTVLLDIVCAAILVLLLVYTRMTYGLVALGFLLFMLTDRRQWRWVLGALLLVLLSIGLIELIWRHSAAYADDIVRSFGAGGLLRGTPGQILDHLLANFADYLLFATLAGLALWRRMSVRDLLFFVLIAAAGFWLINQNEQRWGIIALHALMMVAAERLLRFMDEAPERNQGPLVNVAGVQLYGLAVLLPTIVHCALSLLLHAGVALTGNGRALPLPGLANIRLANLWTPVEFGGSNWYVGTLETGVAALSRLDPLPERLVVLPGPNPFSFMLGLEPARGDVVDMRWNATLNQAYHVPPFSFLQDTEIVVERVTGGGAWETGALYLPLVQQEFTVASEGPDWRIHRRIHPEGEGEDTPSAPPGAQAGR